MKRVWRDWIQGLRFGSRAMQVVGALAVSLAGAGPLDAAAPPYEKRNFTYKRVRRCSIHLDTYRLPGDEVRPVILWIHGGALIAGHRSDLKAEHLSGAQLQQYLKAGFVLVSIDYRLAPETKLEGILEDIRDAHRWIRSKGPQLLQIDPERLAVVGHSAGGYLTLMCGFTLSPQPRALVSFYGFGDITGEWLTNPGSFPESYANRIPVVSQDEARAAVDGPVVSQGSDNRFVFFDYCRQQGIWPREVTGRDPKREPRYFDRYCPTRNVTTRQPPTLLLHGTRDEDVPYQQSVQMAAVLERNGVEHQLITIPDGGHGFDSGKTWLQDPSGREIFERVLAFLKDHTR